MENTVLAGNEAKRLNLPLWMLICFAPYVAWQMGVMYFSGEALSIGGRTPLPVDVGNLTALVGLAYFLGVVYIFFFHKYSVITARVLLSIALASSLGLYLPLSPAVLAVLFFIQVFCCVFLIIVFFAIAGNLYTETTAIRDVIVRVILSGSVIAVLHNEIIPLSFDVFLPVTIVCIASALFYCFRMPANTWQRYVKKQDKIVMPKRFIIQLQALNALACFMALFGTALAESTPNGVSVYYIAAAVSGIILVFLWKRFNIAPLRSASVLVALSALGFILAILSLDIPALALVASILLGLGYSVCCLGSYLGVVMIRRYPSKYNIPIIGISAIISILISSALLEAFRDNLHILYSFHLIIAVGLSVLYLLLEPYLSYSFRGKSFVPPDTDFTDNAQQSSVQQSRALEEAQPAQLQPSLLKTVETSAENLLSAAIYEKLNVQELRVAELSLQGYSYTEIAKVMTLSPNTVKTYYKTLYGKLGINSKLELFSLAKGQKI